MSDKQSNVKAQEKTPSPPSGFKDDLLKMINQYLATGTNLQTKEFEVRFKPHRGHTFTKTEYDNVIRRMRGHGFQCENESGDNMLRIQSQHTNAKTGAIQMSNVRAELFGAELIQQYCRSDNNLKKLADVPANFKKIKFSCTIK